MRYRTPNSNNIEEWHPNEGVPYRGATAHFPEQHLPVWQPKAKPESENPEEEIETENLEVGKLATYGEEVEEPPLPAPVPVSVIDLPTVHEFKMANFGFVTVTEAVPRRLVGRHRQRTRLVIRVFGSNNLWINKNSSVGENNGYRLNPGQSPGEEFSTQDEVWVIADGTGGADVSFYEEYVQLV